VSFSDDPGFDFGIRAALNGVAYHMAEVGEVLAVAGEVEAGDADGWFDAWSRRAHGLREVARAAEAAGRRQSAALTWLRVSNYLFAAFWYIPGTTRAGRAREAWEEHRQAFEAAARLWRTPIERLEVPTAAGPLEAYLWTPDGPAGRPRPLVVLVNGIDTPMTDAFMIGAQDAVDRGYAAVMVDAPGRGAALWRGGLAARPEEEATVAPLLDLVLARDDVDAGRVAMIGVSHGGWLAARAAAFEPRVRALVLDPPIMRVADGFLGQFPDAVQAAFTAGDRAAFDAALARAAAGSADVRFAAAKVREPFAGAAAFDALTVLAAMDLAPVAGRITCPVMTCEPEEQEAYRGQAAEVVAEVGGPVHREVFTTADGAGLDCEIPAPQVRNQRVFDWIDGVLGA
jgi:hypothetical protein